MMNKLELSDISNTKRDEIIGLADFLPDYYSTYLKNERDIIIWLPPSYQSGFKDYPVIYMHDGQNLFNPNTSFIGYDWKVDETVNRLIKKNLIDEVIVIGIYNTRDRLKEYNYFEEKGKQYANFIIKELKPYIDYKYRTLATNYNTAIIGSSMGGLISFQLSWYYPEVFAKCAALSSSFWVNERRIFEIVKNDTKPKKNLNIYIDCGSLEKELIADTNRMINLLETIGYKKESNLYYHIEKGGVHSEVDWAKRLEIPLTYLFGKKYVYF